MFRIVILVAIVTAAVAGAVAFYRRRTSHVLEYEVHPPMPSAMTAEGESDQQMPDYYGGERLGQLAGTDHFAAASQAKG